MPELKFERFLKPPSSHAAASTAASLTKRQSLFSVASSSASSLLGGISKSMGIGGIGSPLRSAALAASASASSLLRLSSPLLSSLSPSPLSPSAASSTSSAHSADEASESESQTHTQPIAEAAVLDLPRGAALIIGGDLAYPTPTPEMYEKRLFAPFQVLCTSLCMI
jgi:hypothetical protein